MEQDTRAFLEQMEKRLEDKIQSFMSNTTQTHKEIHSRHNDFRLDLKQIFERIDNVEKREIDIKGQIKHLKEHNNKGEKDKSESNKLKWSLGVGFILILATQLLSMFLK